MRLLKPLKLLKPSKTKFSVIFALAAMFAAGPTAQAAQIEYPAGGGMLTFNTDTAAITGCEKSVSAAYIPEQINGITVRSVGDYAFTACDMLLEVRLPETVESIGYHAFEYCEALENISLPKNVKVIEAGAFAGCVNLKSLDIPGSVKEISTGLCLGDSGLKSLTLSEGTEIIGKDAFDGCDSLESVVIPDSVTELCKCAFGGTSLKTVTIGSGIKYLRQWAFHDCTSLKSAYFRSASPPSGGMQPFRSSAKGFTIYYPDYAADGWQSGTWHGYRVKQYPRAVTAIPLPFKPASANPSKAQVYVNDELVDFDAFMIEGNNYFKLRDLAYALRGTRTEFEVEWDETSNAIILTTLSLYTPVGGELGGRQKAATTASPTRAKVYWDGREVYITAYNIGGNNYFKLRDVGELFDFGVKWRDSKVIIDTSREYNQ